MTLRAPHGAMGPRAQVMTVRRPREHARGGRPEAEAGHVMTTRRKIEVAVVVIGLVVLFGTIGTVLLSLFLGIG